MASRLHTLVALATLGACAAATSGEQGVSVAVTPPTARVAPGGTALFQAAVSGSIDTAVTWTVQEGAQGGNVSSGGLYTAPATTGVFHVVATARADGTRSASSVVTVAAPTALAVTTTALPGGTVGTAYAATLGATGGTPPYSWSIASGALPSGLSLQAATGLVGGIPASAGTATFTARVSDSQGRIATADLGIEIGAASAIDQSILPEPFRTAWNPGIPGGIPRDDDPVRPATVWLPAGNPYGGYSVNPTLQGTANASAFTAALQAAINAAGAAATPSSRRVVLLPAGTFFVTTTIFVRVNNVVVRGQGADRTRVAAAGRIPEYGTVILFGHRSGRSDADFAVRAVTADALRGSTTIQVATTAGLAVGDVITIDKQDGPAGAALTGSPTANPHYINGGYIWFNEGDYFKRQPTYSWNGPGTGAPDIRAYLNTQPDPVPNSGVSYIAQNLAPQWRSVQQATEITAIGSGTVTVRDPLVIDFPLSLAPQVWLTVPASPGSVPLGNRWSGLEDLAVAGGNNDWGFPGGNIGFSYMAYAWAKNVEADGERWSSPVDPAHPGKYGYNIGLGRCYRCVVRDSYAHGSTDQNPGGQAYGIVIGVGSSACLVENNISVNNNKPIALNATGGGNVIAYNYVDEAVIWGSPGWQENGIDDCHAHFTHHDLVEGNWTPNLGADSTHGNSGWHTHLRNYASGMNSSGGMTSNLRAVGVDGWTHDHAYVGNVLRGGSVYETTPTSRSGRPIYQLGNNYGGAGGAWDNGYAAAHIFRDGNWDDVNRGVVWAAGPRTIPASFYLTGKPAFFGSLTWPWVDPTSGTAYTLPAKARYDAGQPNAVP